MERAEWGATGTHGACGGSEEEEETVERERLVFIIFFLAILGFVAVNLAQILPSHGSGTEHRESGVSGGRIAAGAQEAELRSIAHG